ncbi:MAG: hypothetical protein HQL57_05585 [Magnetococcales bacterium]|nr:hypothetical protein [Magnetococcales bacterium]
MMARPGNFEMVGGHFSALDFGRQIILAIPYEIAPFPNMEMTEKCSVSRAD